MKKSKEKAITLISLIITVTIMLILAAVAINLTIGDNGIFRTAEYAREKYKEEQDKELKDIENLYSSMLVATGDNTQITISMEDLKTLINNTVQEEMQNMINSNNLGKYKAGKVTLPSISNHGYQSVDVSFTEPFEDSNYVVIITSSYSGSYWAQTSYTAVNLTKDGFKISSFIDADATVAARTVFWYAIPIKN